MNGPCETGAHRVPGPDELCAEFLEPGDHLHIASTMSRPNVLVLAVARVFGARGRFTVSSNALHAGVHALTMAGAVRHAVTGFAGDTVPYSAPNRLYRDLAEGRPFTVEEWSLLSLVQRLVAGATGLPAAVTSSLAGSDLPRGASVAPVRTPAPAGDAVPAQAGPPDGDVRPGLLIPPLRPDVTLLHAQCADRLGNLYLAGPLGEGPWGALAARRGVLATVERVVDEPPAGADCSIPADRVLSLAVCPWGAHPQGLAPLRSAGVAGYLDDYGFLADLAAACRTPRDTERWFRRWVGEVTGHADHLARLGPRRLAGLRLDGADPRETGVDPAAGRTAPAAPAARAVPAAAPERTGQPTPRERHIVLAARAIARRVLDRGYRTALAGIGTAHIATWLAAHLLAERGVRLQVCAELGMIDFSPEPGDTFLFSQRHVARCRRTGGILDVLGGLAGGGAGRTLGVLSTAQIDAAGALNTSRRGDGRFLVGSGGANDIASHVDTVVVAPASPRRYVPAVDFVTSPGHNVRCAVAEFGAFTREHAAEPFTLTSWSPPPGSGGTPRSAIEDLTSWKPLVARELPTEDAVTAGELDRLRALDPEGVYR
ncbi:CoA-transferase [Streptomyces sp. TRM 70361]|uniref:CoA-transferase n=1 Tax=Streptomyces sp. TRM 70361 TaxID=3116553 RepID=UPI002E7C4790|nr:CoA-transferase [Streptomyces sp. TRM 70361]MEE1942792.1 CoA-transferase [Streptomyces sp. TRM 70361]